MSEQTTTDPDPPSDTTPEQAPATPNPEPTPVPTPATATTSAGTKSAPATAGPSSLTAAATTGGSTIAASAPALASLTGLGTVGAIAGIGVGGAAATYGAVKTRKSRKSSAAGHKAHQGKSPKLGNLGSGPGRKTSGSALGSTTGKKPSARSLGLSSKHPGGNTRKNATGAHSGKSAAKTGGSARSGNPLGSTPTSKSGTGRTSGVAGGKNHRNTPGGNHGTGKTSSLASKAARTAGKLGIGPHRNKDTPAGGKNDTGRGKTGPLSRAARTAGRATGKTLRTAGKVAGHGTRGALNAGKAVGARAGRIAGWSRKDGSPGWLQKLTRAIGRGAVRGGRATSGFLARLFGKIPHSKPGRKIAGWLRTQSKTGHGNAASAQLAAWILALWLKFGGQHTGQQSESEQDTSSEHHEETNQDTSEQNTSTDDSEQNTSTDDSEQNTSTDDSEQNTSTNTGGKASVNPDGSRTRSNTNNTQPGDKVSLENAIDAAKQGFSQINPENDDDWDTIKHNMNDVATYIRAIGHECLTPMAQRHAETRGLSAAMYEVLAPLARHMENIAAECERSTGVVRTRQGEMVQYAEEGGSGVFDQSRQNR